MSETHSIFDLAALAQQYGISADSLEKLTKQARDEFGSDDMMVELHVVRAMRYARKTEQTRMCDHEPN